MEPQLKRSVGLSLALSLAASIAIYLLLWGLQVTHEEVNVPAGAAFSLAVWSFPVVFLVSLFFFAVKGASARKP
ncbi:MAG: hypothetical protein LAO03_21200 [Acidobacteriia bacterium]|nr:hypothetical protein [Terriglobia bacterium]